MTSSAGRARATSSASPPHMIVSVPSSARGDDPVTGASTSRIPCAESASPIAVVSVGAIVDMSTQSRPAAAPWTAPSSPSRTSRTCAPSTTIVMSTSHRAASSTGVVACAAPCSAAHAAALPGVRVATVSAKPARARFAAIREPMMPRP